MLTQLVYALWDETCSVSLDWITVLWKAAPYSGLTHGRPHPELRNIPVFSTPLVPEGACSALKGFCAKGRTRLSE